MVFLEWMVGGLEGSMIKCMILRDASWHLTPKVRCNLLASTSSWREKIYLLNLMPFKLFNASCLQKPSLPTGRLSQSQPETMKTCLLFFKNASYQLLFARLPRLPVAQAHGSQWNVPPESPKKYLGSEAGEMKRRHIQKNRFNKAKRTKPLQNHSVL